MNPYDPGINSENGSIVSDPQAVGGNVESRQAPDGVAAGVGVLCKRIDLGGNAPCHIGRQGSQVFEGTGKDLNFSFGRLVSAFLPRFST